MKKRGRRIPAILLAAALLCAPMTAQAQQPMPEAAAEDTARSVWPEQQKPELLVQDDF